MRGQVYDRARAYVVRKVEAALRSAGAPVPHAHAVLAVARDPALERPARLEIGLDVNGVPVRARGRPPRGGGRGPGRRPTAAQAAGAPRPHQDPPPVDRHLPRARVAPRRPAPSADAVLSPTAGGTTVGAAQELRPGADGPGPGRVRDAPGRPRLLPLHRSRDREGCRRRPRQARQSGTRPRCEPSAHPVRRAGS